MNVVASIPAGPVVQHSDHSIGGILVDAGRLKLEDAERILQFQRQKGLRFGDAGIQLGLLTDADIRFAVARQFNHPYLARGESRISEDLVAAYESSGPNLEALRALRSQLMLRWFDTDPAHKALAIISSDRREGRSYIAANLAVAFSQLGERTLLIDADMRNPSQHKLFGLDDDGGLSAVLSGRGRPVTVKHVPGLPDLWLLPAGAPPPNALELLGRPQFRQLLGELAQKFSVILLDSPASRECADGQTVAVRAGAALIIVRKNTARMWRVRGVSDAVAQGNTTVVGTVLNDY